MKWWVSETKKLIGYLMSIINFRISEVKQYEEKGKHRGED